MTADERIEAALVEINGLAEHLRRDTAWLDRISLSPVVANALVRVRRILAGEPLVGEHEIEAFIQTYSLGERPR